MIPYGMQGAECYGNIPECILLILVHVLQEENKVFIIRVTICSFKPEVYYFAELGHQWKVCNIHLVTNSSQTL